MASASDDTAGISVTSWGWADEDGNTTSDGVRVPRDEATFCVWAVRSKGERVGMLLLPAALGAVDALLVARRAFTAESYIFDTDDEGEPVERDGTVAVDFRRSLSPPVADWS